MSRAALAIRSVANLREHWAVKAKRAKCHRLIGCLLARAAWPGPATAVEIKITRVAPRSLDGDNMQSACKSLRDGIADGLGLPNDADPRVTWTYAQRRGKPREYAVEVDIAARERAS